MVNIEIVYQEELVELAYQTRQVTTMLTFGVARMGDVSSLKGKISASRTCQNSYYRESPVSKGVTRIIFLLREMEIEVKTF